MQLGLLSCYNYMRHANADNGGIASYNAYPSTEQPGPCKNPLPPNAPYTNVGGFLTLHVRVSTNPCIDQIKGVTTLKQSEDALVAAGTLPVAISISSINKRRRCACVTCAAVATAPIAVGVEADEAAWQMYEGGVLTGQCGSTVGA